MAAPTARVTITALTRYGVGIVFRFYVPAAISGPTDALLTTIADRINIACAAKVISIEVTREASLAGSAVAAAYTCEDKMIITVPDDTGENHVFKIPALKPTILTADGSTLDLTDPLVVELSTQIAALCRGQAGDDLAAIKRGHRAGGTNLR